MNSNRTNNDRNQNNNGNKKSKLIRLIIIAALFVITLVVTGNYKTFLPFIDWGDTEGSSLVGTEIFPEDMEQNEEDSSVAAESSLPEDSASAVTTAPPATTPTPDTTSAPESSPIPETTATEPEITEPESDAVEISYYFRNKSTYDSHYEKHKDEFGDITQEDYLRMANELIFSDADTVLTKYEDDGDFMYFDTATGYFLVLSPDDYIRTFFVPTDGIDYWNRQ